MENKDKEFNSVVLAALLHDIGKLLHRGGGEYKGTHEEASYKFIQKHESRLRSKLYDISLVSCLARFHGSSQVDTFRDEYFADKRHIDRKRIWKLITIVKRADCYSCAERDTQEQRRRDIQISAAPLDSIFSLVNQSNQKETSVYRYSASKLDPLACFPEQLKEIEKGNLRQLISDFESAIPDFSTFRRLDDVLNAWLSLLERYGWAIPSDTRYAVSDISLYDHLRSSAAISACLYKRHIAAIDELKGMVKTDEFVFVGGDFSGIQDFIFDITNKGSGGASKRLRARSFFVSLFSEVTVHKILHALNLPLLCNIFSAGGKFLLLAPNVADTPKILEAVKFEIESEIHERFFTQFAFLLSWKPIKGFRKQFGVYTFFRVADEMFHALEAEKVGKAKAVLLHTDKQSWDGGAFKATKLYEQYSGSTDCRICGRGPATFPDPETDRMDCCSICYSDRFIIGQTLPRVKYVAFGRGILDEETGRKITLFRAIRPGSEGKKEGYYIELLRQLKQCDDYYLIYAINESAPQTPGTQNPPAFTKYFANHVPIDLDGSTMGFEEIAKLPVWQKNGATRGSDLLGVLKADIDNLGYTFSKGFESPGGAEEDLPQVDRKTVSRFLTMSRMIELFFSGWMNAIMSAYKDRIVLDMLSLKDIDSVALERYLRQDSVDFKNIYTVYSGGDDMVLVGPWETMIIFAIYLNMQFKKYTCDNDAITLSAGLAFVKDRHPIASAIRQAEALLDESKGRGKDSISLFGTSVKWSRLPQLVDFFLFLNEKVNEDASEINAAFLHRLYVYHRMALRFLDTGEIESLKYLPYLSYDIGRNIVKWDEYGRIKKGAEEYSVLQSLVNQKLDRDSLLYNIKVPLFWTLYRNRRSRGQ